MSVSNPEFIRFYPFPGFEDPSLPAGSWAGVSSILGDASGGTRISDLTFAPSGQSLGSRMYSLEQISISDENNSDQDVTLQSIALGKAGDIDFDSLFAQLFLTAGPTLAAVNARDLVALKGWYLGRTNRNTVPAKLRLTAPNSDGDILILQAEGYWWDARTLNVRGGPSRPPAGMYK